MKIKAKNRIVLVDRDKAEISVGGIAIPGIAQKPIHKGRILSVGSLVEDKTIKEGGVAIFNKSAGFTIEEDGIKYLVLNQEDIIGGD